MELHAFNISAGPTPYFENVWLGGHITDHIQKRISPEKKSPPRSVVDVGVKPVVSFQAIAIGDMGMIFGDLHFFHFTIAR
jgi:hypothetical protein